MNKLAYLLLIVLGSCTTATEPIKGGLTVNPYGDTPLSALYKLDRINTEPITVTVLGKTEDMNISHTYPANYGTELAIHGLYPNYNNTILIQGKEIDIQTNIMTSSLPNDVTVTINRTDFVTGDPFNQDLYFLLGYDNSAVAFDNKGDVRYRKSVLDEPKQMARIAIEDNQVFIWDALGKMDLLGNRTIFNPSSGHHDVIPYKNNYLFLSHTQWGVEDRLIETTASGAIVNDKTFGKLFRDIIEPVNNADEIAKMNKIIYDDENIYNVGGKKTIDWAHANSLVYDNDTDILYLSLRHQAVIAVDYSEWKLLWWMADDTLDTIHWGVPNVGMNFIDLPSLEPYRVKGAGKTYGPKNQHALLLRKNGNLGMFDNQGDAASNPNGSRYIEYSIRKINNQYTATVAHEYRDPTPINTRMVYSQVMSDVDLLPNNKLLILSSIGTTIREVDLDTKQVELDMTFNLDWVYRTDKMPLYPYQDPNKIYSIDYNEKLGL